MTKAGIILLLICASISLARSDVVGTLNIHTAPDGHTMTGQDSGQPVEVRVDFSGTQDGTYDLSVWSGGHQLEKVIRVYVRAGEAAQREEPYRPGPVAVYCPATHLSQNEPTSFQVFAQAVFENGEKGGRVLIAEADWHLSSLEDSQPGKKIEPRTVITSAGTNLDSHATGSFFLKNQSEDSLRATLFFGGRKYGDYNLSGHGNQRVQADAWGVNPGVGWYVTTPNSSSPGGQQIEAAGPIYNSEGGSESGFNTVELNGPSPSPTARPSSSPAQKP
ncbi:MAG: hypothetical protein JO279_03485 [Verrucomicrobia bacterium]|nr:hypothetical protein [Verrucomicrobiota bacterium]